MMRILVFAFSFSLLSCSSANSEDEIVGKWLFIKTDISALDQTMAGASNIQANPMEDAMRGLTYEFFPDHTFMIGAKSPHGGTPKPNGTYSLINDGKAIELKKNGSSPNQKNKIMNIPVLNADSLVLEEQGVKLIFLRQL